jgi:hypothetical protein
MAPRTLIAAWPGKACFIENERGLQKSGCQGGISAQAAAQHRSASEKLGGSLKLTPILHEGSEKLQDKWLIWSQLEGLAKVALSFTEVGRDSVRIPYMGQQHSGLRGRQRRRKVDRGGLTPCEHSRRVCVTKSVSALGDSQPIAAGS